MARKPNPLPDLRQHKSGQFYIHFNGKRTYLGVDREKAEERRKRMLADSILGGSTICLEPHKKKLTVAEACESAEKWSEQRHMRGHHARFVRGLDAVYSLYGSQFVDAFDQLALQRVRAHLLTEKCSGGPSRGEPLSRPYVNRCIKAIVQSWAWLESQRQVPDGSTARLRTVQALRAGAGGREIEPPGAVDAAIVERTLPWLTPTVRDMVRIQMLTGMRPGEMCRIRPCDIARTPTDEVQMPGRSAAPVRGVVVDGVPVWFYVPATHKTRYKGKLRVVAIGPAAQAILSPLLNACKSPTAFVFMTAWPGKKPNRFQPGPYSQAIRAGIARHRRAKPKDSPIPSWSPGQLRHNAATLFRDRFGQDAAAAALGHATPDTTAIYAEAAIGQSATIAAKVG